ncbi:DUF3108 domain-containing protein [candidate division WOR-3 bacterium]|nr:DUF3108 domain-containing protein [candidate division WOR-3 bacterium]
MLLYSILALYLSFPIGERMSYGAYFGPLRAGYSVMEIKEGDFEGEPSYLIECVQKTEKTFSIVYRIDDYYKSVVDTSSFSTLSYTKNINEGKYSNDLTLEFTEDSVFYTDGRRTEKIPDAKDIFAALYWMRCQTFYPGDTLKVPFHSSGKNQEMIVPISDLQWTTVPMGKFRTFLLTPQVKDEKIFGSEEPIKIWVSVDPQHLPVKIESKLKVGKISFQLEEINVIGEER